MREFLKRRIAAPLLAQLRQGASPEALARSCAAGAALGVVPVLGTTTALCLLAGIFFRLNHAALQAVNYAAYPLQLALIPVFVRVGETMFGAAHVPLSPGRLAGEFAADPGLFLRRYGLAGAYGLAAWAVIAAPAAWAVYRVLLPVFRRAAERFEGNSPLVPRD